MEGTTWTALRAPSPLAGLGGLIANLGLVAVTVLLAVVLFILMPLNAFWLGMRLSTHLSQAGCALIYMGAAMSLAVLIPRRCGWTRR